MPKRFPPEFKADVVRVARRGDLSVAEVAADFDISVQSVQRWKRQADIDDGIKDGLTWPSRPKSSAGQDEPPTRDGERDPDGEPPPTSPGPDHKMMYPLVQSSPSRASP